MSNVKIFEGKNKTENESFENYDLSMLEDDFKDYPICEVIEVTHHKF